MVYSLGIHSNQESPLENQWQFVVFRHSLSALKSFRKINSSVVLHSPNIWVLNHSRIHPTVWLLWSKGITLSESIAFSVLLKNDSYFYSVSKELRVLRVGMWFILNIWLKTLSVEELQFDSFPGCILTKQWLQQRLYTLCVLLVMAVPTLDLRKMEVVSNRNRSMWGLFRVCAGVPAIFPGFC